MLPDLAGAISALSHAGVRFVAIGGIAVAAHRVIRATEDLDLVPDPARESIDALANVLVALCARLLRNPEREVDAEVRTALHRSRNLTVTTSRGDIDIVQRLPGVPSFAILATDAWEATIFDVPFLVCSRAHLIAMKRARGSALDHLIAMKRARGSALDQADLERLLDPGH